MEHPQTTPNEQEQHRSAVPPSPEREPASDVRIYVASLSDYNDGRLHGAWLDAATDVDELAAGIKEMLDRSPTPGAEEWAIHDYEGFGPLHLGEYENLATISQIAQGIATHGPAFAHWAAHTGTADRDELARFDDVYLGRWSSVESYAEELLDDLGLDDLIEAAVPESLQAYVRVDVEGFARDLEYSGELATSEGDDGVYLFDQTR